MLDITRTPAMPVNYTANLAPHVRSHPIVAACIDTTDKLNRYCNMFPEHWDNNTGDFPKIEAAYSKAMTDLFHAVPRTPDEGCILAAALFAICADGGAGPTDYGEFDLSKWIAHLSAASATRSAPKRRAA